MPVEGIGDAARALLTLVEDTAAAEGVTLPARRYIGPGEPAGQALDDEQVTVSLASVPAGTASTLTDTRPSRSGAPGGAAPMGAAVLVVDIVRCVPTIQDGVGVGRLPTLDELTAAGLVGMRDAHLLHLVRAQVVTTAALTGGTPGDVQAGAVTVAGPSGGVASVSLQVAVTLL